MDRKIVLFCIFPQIVSTSDVSTLDADETLNFLSACGQNVTLSNTNKMIVLQGVIVHDVLGCPKIVLAQIREGMQILSFGAKMKQYPELFQELFVPHNKECSHREAAWLSG